MAITISGATDAKSATVGSLGSLTTYFYDVNGTTWSTLLSGTAQTFANAENWTTSNFPAPTQYPMNYTYWGLGPNGFYPFEGKAKGRFAMSWTAPATLVGPLGVDALNFTSQNYNITYGFEPTVSLSTGSGSGTIITVASTANLQPGYVVSVSAGTGSFSTNTLVTGVISATQFTVNTAPTVALSGATILATPGSGLTGTASSSGTTITMTGGTTVGLVVGSVVYTNTATATGYFAAGTYVTAVTSSTQFTVSAAPTVALSSAGIGFNNGLIGWGSSTANNAGTGAFSSYQQMGNGLLIAATNTVSTNVVTVSSTTGIYPGMYVVIRTGTGTIPAGTIVTGIVSSTQFTMSNISSVAISGSVALMNFPYAGASSNYRFLQVTSDVMTSATAQGPLTGYTNSTGGWLVNYYDAAGTVNWMYSPELPMYASPYQSIMPRDINNFYLMGRIQASTSTSVTLSTISANMPTWVTNPTYSIPSMTGANGSGTTITVASIPQGLQVGAPVIVTAGTGAFAAGTTITAINSSTTFTVSAAPTVALSGATILLANTSTNGGLPAGLSLNTSTGQITGTLAMPQATAGLNVYQFCVRCDFTFGSAGTASYSSGTGALGLTGSNTGNFYYEVYDTSSSLQSQVAGDVLDLVELSTAVSVYVPSSSANTIPNTNVVSPGTIDVAAGDRTSPNADPHKTSIIIIG